MAPDPDEGRECGIDLRLGESGRHLRANACLALWHYWKGEADHVDPLGEQKVGKARCERGIADHHGNDGVLTWQQPEAGGAHARTELACMREQCVAQLR